MTSNHSFFNVRLLRETMRRNLWATVLSFIGFFFCLPLPVAMIVQNMSRFSIEVSRATAIRHAAGNVAGFLGGNAPLTKIGMCIMAVLCGIALFSYLHSRQRVDFYHALPIRREALFVNNYIAGILTVLPAYLIMYALALVISGVLGVGQFITAGVVLKALAINILFFLLIYTVSVLATVLTGNVIVAVLLDGWLLFSLPGVAAILEWICSENLVTWSSSAVLDRMITYLSPVLLFFFTGSDWGIEELTHNMAIVKVLLTVLVVWLVLLALALYLFKLRKSERAGTAIAFEGLKAPLKWYMVVLVGLFCGMLFQTISDEIWLWFGLIVGIVLAHMLVEIIYHFDLRSAFTHWKTMIVLAVAAVAIIVGIQHDVMGYNKWVPAESSIAQIDGFNANYQTDDGNPYAYNESMGNLYIDDSLTDPETIAKVRALAELCRNQVQEGHDSFTDQEDVPGYIYVNVTYKLKNGSSASRHYDVTKTDEIMKLVNEIQFSADYRKSSEPVFRVSLKDYTPKDAKNEKPLLLSVRTNADPSDVAGVEISDFEQSKEIIKTLREETLTLTREQATTQVPVLRIDARYYYKDADSNAYAVTTQFIPVYASYTKTLALLKEYGNVEPRALTVSDMKGITISWGDSQNEVTMEGDTWTSENWDDVGSEFTTRTMHANGAVDVTDPAQMQTLLQNAMLEPVVFSCDSTYAVDTTSTYMLEVKLSGNRTCTLYYPAGKTPNAACDAIRKAAQ